MNRNSWRTTVHQYSWNIFQSGVSCLQYELKLNNHKSFKTVAVGGLHRLYYNIYYQHTCLMIPSNKWLSLCTHVYVRSCLRAVVCSMFNCAHVICVFVPPAQAGQVMCRRMVCDCDNPNADLFCCPECDPRLSSQCLHQNGLLTYGSGDTWVENCQQCQCLVSRVR